jgi:hypothetical protein
MSTQPANRKEARLAGLISLALAIAAISGFIYLWWLYVLCVFGSVFGLVVGIVAILINRMQGRVAHLAIIGVLANLAVLVFFAYLRLSHGPIVD